MKDTAQQQFEGSHLFPSKRGRGALIYPWKLAFTMARRGEPDNDDVYTELPDTPTRGSNLDDTEAQEDMKGPPLGSPQSTSTNSGVEKQAGMADHEQASTPRSFPRKSSRPAFRLSIQESTEGPGKLPSCSQLQFTPVADELEQAYAPVTESIDRDFPTSSDYHDVVLSEHSAVAAPSDGEELPIVATVVRLTSSHTQHDKKTIPFSFLVRDRRVQYVVATFTLIVIGLSVGLAFAFTNTGSSSDLTATPILEPTSTPSSSPSTSAPTWTYQDAIETMLSTDLPMTPVAQNAMRWVHDDENLATFTDDRIRQRFGLASLFFEIKTNGPPLLWENDIMLENECEWTGITCDSEGKVEFLDIRHMQLKGTLPAQLSLLTELKRLQIFDNKFRGDIPAEFQALTKIRGIELGDNEYTGTIPSNLFLMTTLNFLHMDFNNFEQGPFPIGLLDLPQLRSFGLRATQRIGTIPEEIFRLPLLQRISCASNQLTGTLSTRLQSVLSLHVGQNYLNGTIPSELGLLTNLEHLDIFENEFTGSIPTELGLCTKLKGMDLSTNSLTGTLPEEVMHLTNLRFWFGFARNKLSGTISTGIGRLSRLDHTLELHDNQFTGTIPSEFGLLTGLSSTLTLQHNLLKGTLPTELGNLSLLPTMGLQHNPALQGTIPLQFGNMTSIERLELYNTALTGSVPEQLCRLRIQGNLSELIVNCNVSCSCCVTCFF